MRNISNQTKESTNSKPKVCNIQFFDHSEGIQTDFNPMQTAKSKKERPKTATVHDFNKNLRGQAKTPVARFSPPKPILMNPRPQTGVMTTRRHPKKQVKIKLNVPDDVLQINGHTNPMQYTNTDIWQCTTDNLGDIIFSNSPKSRENIMKTQSNFYNFGDQKASKCFMSYRGPPKKIGFIDAKYFMRPDKNMYTIYQRKGLKLYSTKNLCSKNTMVTYKNTNNTAQSLAILNLTLHPKLALEPEKFDKKGFPLRKPAKMQSLYKYRKECWNKTMLGTFIESDNVRKLDKIMNVKHLSNSLVGSKEFYKTFVADNDAKSPTKDTEIQTAPGRPKEKIAQRLVVDLQKMQDNILSPKNQQISNKVIQNAYQEKSKLSSNNKKVILLQKVQKNICNAYGICRTELDLYNSVH